MHSSPVSRRWISLSSAAVAFAIALPVSALAPTDQYAKYSNDTLTISDLHTGLEWDRHPNLNTQSSTIDYPPAVNFDAAVKQCRDDGKRLPSLKELLTIVDEAPYSKYVVTKNEPRYLDQNAFDNTPNGGFWTSSLVPNGNSAYTVDFFTGFVGTGTTTGGTPDSRYVRCVK